MTQQEFEQRIGTEVATSTFDFANRVYMAAGEMDKDTFCADWKQTDLTTSNIASALTLEVEQLQGALASANKAYENAERGMRDFADQMADFLILQAEKWSATDLREKAIKMVGFQEYIRRRLEFGFDLWEADRAELIKILSK